ncbi:MAG: transcription-repair coupling factor [Bacteroidales bacterium]|nr:transcription-repair coupling factor [Bacteroidales bacterium]
MIKIATHSSKELQDKIIKGEKNIFCSGLFLSARWYILSQSAPERTNIVILPNQEAAEYCAADLYNLIPGDSVYFLPATKKSTERSSHKASLSVQRTSAISKLIEKDSPLFIVTYPEAIEERVPKTKEISSSIFKIKKGEEISHTAIKETLISMGFEKTDFVSTPGQYAIRGSVIDIFSYSGNHPYRLSFFGDEVENIHIFDCNTQLSIEKTDEAEIISSFISDEAEEGENLINLFPENAILWLDSSDMYKEEEFFSETKNFTRVFMEVPLGTQDADPVKFSISPQPVFNKNFELLSADLRSRMDQGYKVYILGEKQSQLDRLKSILSQDLTVLPELVKGDNVHSGFIDNENRVCIYSDHEIFDRFHRVSIRRSVEKTEQLTLNDLNSFNIGDYVVHIDHGIGVFGGLVRMRDDHDRVKEVVKISYRDGDVVFVSVHALNKISRYRSKDGEPPRINKLGSKAWLNFKTGAKARVKDIAKDLIQLYAKRKATRGYAFSPDSYLQEELESSFMYEDTPDQELASIAIKHDMEDNCPMDRLICGDVGFGKTELAIRAAFKAVCDGKQAAILVPTTILALQHFNTFSSRLQDLPCRVDYVSRLRSAKELTAIKNDLKAGRIDIIIGTHKILSEAFEFRDLGLLVIDEEQKFGVSAKERLRQMRAGIDTLTLTATPIPRTLQFSLLGARDLSIIGTPPPNRIPIQTEIILFDQQEIRSILNYELNRGGQIFFLHNKVEELQSISDILHRLVPEMKICIAHGQMAPRDIENRMLEFMRGDYDLLLCTTIIENGLDIPNANTILINQAQNIGLSDLHQLRGRVGRSNRKAFCYLIVPPLATVTDDARRRLKAIETFSDLGSGFNIAMQDLDIRGAGNLLGAEQSGFISEMGYETYQKILAEAMQELGVETGSKAESRHGKFVTDCTIDTDQQAFIPDDYIDVPSEKMRIYKQLDSFSGEKEISRFASQMEDRFGAMPPELVNLFDVVRVRNLGASLGFEKIIMKNSLLIAFFVSNQMSPYYQSDTFACILSRLNSLGTVMTLKQSEGRLKIVARGVESIGKAWELLKKLA